MARVVHVLVERALRIVRVNVVLVDARERADRVGPALPCVRQLAGVGRRLVLEGPAGRVGRARHPGRAERERCGVDRVELHPVLAEEGCAAVAVRGERRPHLDVRSQERVGQPAEGLARLAGVERHDWSGGRLAR